MIKVGFKSPLSGWGNIVVGCIIFWLLVFLCWWFLVRPGQIAQERDQAKADSSYSQGRTTSAQEAAGINQGVNERNSQYDQDTNRGNADIQKAPGADGTVTHDVACASARAQCMQRSYKGSEQCRALLSACPS